MWALREDRTLNLWALGAPSLLVLFPTLACVVGLAVLFDCLPWLHGSLGNGVYFFLPLLARSAARYVGSLEPITAAVRPSPGGLTPPVPSLDGVGRRSVYWPRASPSRYLGRGRGGRARPWRPGRPLEPMATLQFHLLLVSPSRARQRLVRGALDARALRLVYAPDLAAAQACCRQTSVDLIILDGTDGAPLAERCALLRQASDAPVLALVGAGEWPGAGPAHASGVDAVLPLACCADQLHTAVSRLLAAPAAAAAREPLHCGDLEIDLAERRVTRAGQLVRLSRTEWALLADLVRHAGLTRTHAALLDRVWGPSYDDATAYLHVYVNRLRRKLEPDPAHPRYLLTEPGLGYRFVRLPPDARGEAAAAPPATELPASAAPPLPPLPTPLFGREGELADLAGQVAGGAPLLTLLGPGGSGKTYLALALAHRLRETGRAVLFVPLAAITDPALILGAVAEAAGLTGGAAGDTAGLAAALQGQAPVVILDNFEQLLPGAAWLGSLLTRLPGLQLVVTSRAPLRLQAEQVVPVDPLPVPAPGSLPPADLLQTPALALFCARARAAVPSFTVAPTEAELLAAICAQLDGMPLAIELAAPWVRVLTLAELHARLHDQLALLVAGAVDRPPRHRSLRAAIDGSYQLLTPAQRASFARLSVFVGGWSLASAAAVCAADAGSLELAADLAALVDSQLVRVVDDAGGARRFTMLETIRAYGLERLAERSDEVAARDRHAAHFRALLAEAEGQGDESEVRRRRLAAERANVRAAMRWLLDRRAPDAAQLVGNLWWFWRDLDDPGEGQRWFDELLARPDLTVSERAAALHGRASVTLLLGAYAAAEDYFAESMRLYADLGDDTAVARAANNLGCAAMLRGDLPRARAFLEECLAVARRLGRPPLLAYACYNLGRTLCYLDEAEADALLAEAHARFRRLEADTLAARALQVRAELARAAGDHVAAAALLLEALAAWRPDTNLRYAENLARLVAECLEASAGVAVARQRWAQAARLSGAAAAVRRSPARLAAPFEWARHEQVITVARAQLGDAAWGATTEAGAALTPGQAVAEARELLLAALRVD